MHVLINPLSKFKLAYKCNQRTYVSRQHSNLNPYCRSICSYQMNWTIRTRTLLDGLSCNIYTWLVTPDFCESRPDLDIGPDFVYLDIQE